MADIVLKMESVSKSYPGVKALDNFSFDVHAGEVHAILGENGSGKSTLMKIASGAITPNAGRIEIGGKHLAHADPREAISYGLATVYQDDSLVRELSVAQNLFLATPKGSVPYGSMVRWAEEQLAPFNLGISPTTAVGNLTPAHRQFVEVVKALLSNPRVLLLDEPTSTLDYDGVAHLTSLVRDLTAKGTGVVYVSHRLPEILDLANRVTILRDGVHEGTFDVTDDTSEQELVSRMIGRDVESEYPAKAGRIEPDPVLVVDGLSGDAFEDISFVANRGEIVGFAGAEGNGQREALRAIAGLEASHSGTVTCKGKAVDVTEPRHAIRSGVLCLSADRAGESIFPDLGVRKNMTLPRLRDFARRGLLSNRQEQDHAATMRDEFGVVTATLETPISGLSGGNQQKVVLARSFRTDAKAVLIDEPTQGVDAGARHDIYQAIRTNLREDGALVINSSDAQELAGICDRVLVFSRGRIVAELTGQDVNEEQIVSSFLRARDAKQAGDTAAGMMSRVFRTLISGSNIWWVPLVFLAALTLIVGGYAALQTDVFLRHVNIRYILLATAPAAMVAMAQLHVLLVRGLDVSVGSMMSLTVVAASFMIAFQMPIGMQILGVLGCLAIGAVVGLINGTLVRFANINAVITTIAMLSVLQGAALLGRPTPAGMISQEFTGLLRERIGFLPISIFVLLGVAIAFDFWLHRTRSGLEAKAVGFREVAAQRNGVRVDRVHVRAYVLAALMATVAGFFLGSEVGVGAPTVGANYALTSIAAAVLGGAALSGGRGSFVGALFGALFFALMVNVITLLGLSTSFGIIASGAMTLFAIFLYSGLGEVETLMQSALRRRKVIRATKRSTA
ncbi:ATP-binding cassette domain-containing protein [Sulfitobacter sp. G21635-S1]|uniref:ATP-binding cassette domain-containing protein n=1 Tax=Sulfitobacter sp. G21635-S1 TaxID=3014043 RepID=UPI0022AEFC67|nr:ATP-binding cassette domain-containing protein [Sulfitobacter sp. G21635-S1]MCZ4254202.1 ATP-binding cassette domain-containing protein [Sulfitobacter sp. G21635-S1]